jgi:SpoVK/Ycf46/Vps4 family AAA+-type ATPase
VDSLLCARSTSEPEHARRLKTEFFAALDGIKQEPDKSVLLVAATNRPQDLDEAALRYALGLNAWASSRFGGGGEECVFLSSSFDPSLRKNSAKKVFVLSVCRRFTKRIYIGMPDHEARIELLGKVCIAFAH